MDAQQLVDLACPKIRDLGWAYYFDPATFAAGEELGLDGFRFYFLGRGGVLGDVEPQVVASAFGYFNPAVVADMWTTGLERAKGSARDIGRAYLGCAADFGRARFAGIATEQPGVLEAFNAAAEAVMAAADPTGLALYAAAAAEPLADDAPGRAMQLVSLLRELRGSAHLIAVRAVGLTPLQAHAVSRPGDLQMFGWEEADVAPITDEVRGLRAEAEALTDRIVLPAYAALDEAQQQALLAGLAVIEAALAP